MYKRFWKRVVDVFLSLFGLLVLFLPMIVISIAIKLDSKGPIFFLQKRFGKNRRLFTIYKFRTMVPNAYVMGGTNTYDGDPRITRVGAFLRKTSLDEVPQLINIIKKDMAIIGPRPILPNEFDEYEGNEKYSSRFEVLPGLFCTVDLKYRAQASKCLQFIMDAEYVREITFLSDLKVFLGIIKIVLTGSNVYKNKPRNIVANIATDVDKQESKTLNEQIKTKL